MEAVKKFKAKEDFNLTLADNKDLATELYFCIGLGHELPKHLAHMKPNLGILRDIVGMVYQKTADRVELPIEIGEINTLRDMMDLNAQVIKAYASGQIGASDADNMFKFIHGHRKMVESVTVMEMLEELKTDQSKIMRMKKVGAGKSMRFIPELAENTSGTGDTIIVDSPSVRSDEDVTPGTRAGQKKQWMRF